MDETTPGKQKEVSTGTKNRPEAEEKLEQFLNQRRRQRLSLAVYPHQITIAQILDDYANYTLENRKNPRLGYSMDHLLSFWQDETADQVNEETIKRYVRTSKRARSTLRRELTDLRSAINHAIKMNRVTSIQFPKLPKDSKPKDRWLTESEFAILLKAGGQEIGSKFTLRLFLIIAFYTGARKQAILELEWSQVDFQTNFINFKKENNEETNKKRAYVPMTPQLRSFLFRRYTRYGSQTSFLFHRKNNPLKQVKNIEKGFRAAVKRAGLEKVTPHTLRHTRVSLMVQSGEKLQDVATYMNMTHQTLEKVYSHHDNERIQQMAARIGRTHKERTTEIKT